jgi:hypothetical protein
MMQNHIRLDDLLARDVAARWFEGVAVVQTVCRQLLAGGSRGFGFPRSSDIFIGPGGSIAIEGTSDGNPVQAAAHVLALMLSDDVPVRLRLAVTQATADESVYASLMEFSEVLAYFERPDPELIVDGFRQRAMLAAPREVASPRRIDVNPVVQHSPAPPPAAAARQVNRVPVIAVTFAAVVCTSVWLVGNRTGQLSAELNTSSENGGSPSSATTTRRQEMRAAKSSVAKLVKKAHSQLRGVPPTRSISASNTDARAAAPTVSASTLYYSYGESLPVPVPERSLAPGILTPLVTYSPVFEEGRIYSTADAQVTLPRNVYPKLPPEPPGLDRTTRTVVELTIDTDGLVERVRLLSPPRDVHEFMLLSAAKAWRFDPATLGGRPVRFRHTLVISAMP